MSFFSKNKKVDGLESTSLVKEAGVFIWELLKVILISLAIIIPVRYFLIQPFYVKGASMEPNFYDHEYLIIDELSYRFREPRRGEVVVFRYPLNPKEYFIKRIIGLPGEKISIVDNVITVFNREHPDGLVISETYLDPANETKGSKIAVLKDDEYYLLGDNRGASLDSRYFGPVNKSYVTGKVLVRGWPISRISLFLQSPEYSGATAQN